MSLTGLTGVMDLGHGPHLSGGWSLQWFSGDTVFLEMISESQLSG